MCDRLSQLNDNAPTADEVLDGFAKAIATAVEAGDMPETVGAAICLTAAVIAASSMVERKRKDQANGPSVSTP